MVEKSISSKLINLSISTEYNCYPQVSSFCVGIVSLKAPLYDFSLRSPVDIVAVIDKSGSMAEKIGLVKAALKFVISQRKYRSVCMYTCNCCTMASLGVLDLYPCAVVFPGL